MKIYIAGPYSAKTKRERLQNAIRAVKAGLIAFKKGHYFFIPHLFHWADQYARIMGLEMAWQDWMKWDSAWLVECDALLYLAPSKGADIELNTAKELGLKIYYSIDDVPDVDRT